MKIVEIFTGTPEEQAAKATLDRLAKKQTLSYPETCERDAAAPHRLRLNIRRFLAVLLPAAIAAGLDYATLTPEELLADLSEEKGITVKNSSLSENPEAPVFILMGDTHGSPEIEADKLQILREEFGINFVGVEGWAGPEADQARGYQMMNGESEFVRPLLKDEQLQVIPLEDPTQQEKALKILTSTLLLDSYFFAAQTTMIEAMEVTGSDQQRILAGTKSMVKMTQDNAVGMIQEDFNIHDCDQAEPVQCDGFKETLLADYGVDYRSLAAKETESPVDHAIRISGQVASARDKAYEAIGGPEVVDERSHIAAARMWLSMQAAGQDVGVIVFGKEHIPQISADLKSLGDCSIIEI